MDVTMDEVRRISRHSEMTQRATEDIADTLQATLESLRVMAVPCMRQPRGVLGP
jgi:hypothetical protein